MRALNVTALALWVGRFLFLILLYAFLFQLYRALLTSPARPAGGETGQRRPAASIRLVSTGTQGEVWVEDGDEKERRLHEGESIDFSDRLEVGRAVGNRIRVLDPFVSAHHCVIERRGLRFVLQDLSTTNGTAVDGRRVQGSCPLKPGAVIEVGMTRFRFETR